MRMQVYTDECPYLDVSLFYADRTFNGQTWKAMLGWTDFALPREEAGHT